MILSIFTPTYNRAHLLERVYDSLKDQRKDFEWIIVDDGSEDDTQAVVDQLKNRAEFPIKYIKKTNGGKHTAHNCAVQAAEGEFFLCLDSDDWLPDGVVDLFLAKHLKLSESECGYIAYKALSNGVSISAEITESGASHSIYEYSHILTRGGEFALIFCTEVLKKFAFPEIQAEKYVGECVLYDKIDLAGYTVKPFPYAVEICEYQQDGLSNAFYKNLIQSPTGYQIYHMQRIDLVASFKERIRHCICYHSFKRLSKNKDYVYHGKHAPLVALLTPTGILGAWYYKMRYSRNRT